MDNDEGHYGLSNERKEQTSSGDFQIALSFLKKDSFTGLWVIHVYSKTYEPSSPYLQRTNLGGSRWKQNFLERLGFRHFSSCNVLDGECYYKVLDIIDLSPTIGSGTFDRMFANTLIIDRYRKFASQLNDLYKKMREIDQMLVDVGFELPKERLAFSAISNPSDDTQKIYPQGYQYDYYRDMSDLLKNASNEVIITDNYANEELINLYIDKIPDNVAKKILIKQSKKPDLNFLTVAKKLKLKPNTSFEVRASDNWHDRWVFIDNECWVTGQSVKDAASKPTYLVKLDGYGVLRSCFDDVWKNATVVL